MFDDLVGIASTLRESLPFQPDPDAWRLRGMAVVERARRNGIGRLLVRECLDYATQMDGTILWCKGRTSVYPFYQSLGFRALGVEVDIPESGPHYIMWIPVSEAQGY